MLNLDILFIKLEKQLRLEQTNVVNYEMYKYSVKFVQNAMLNKS